MATTDGGPVGQSLARHPVLSEMLTFDKESGDLRVVIETPKGSRNKYDYDPEYDCIELATVLPEGMSFPYDFGFLPSTLGEDGDPLDVLVLMDTSVVPGCVVRARLIGVIEATQKDDNNQEPIRNDRLIAVATHARSYVETRSLSDLRPHLVEEIKAFFVQYNQLRDRDFKPLRDGTPQEAKELIEQGIAGFRKRKEE
jgi:inorganic pyrophosphatase